jgi:hypothetical protein
MRRDLFLILTLAVGVTGFAIVPALLPLAGTAAVAEAGDGHDRAEHSVTLGRVIADLGAPGYVMAGLGLLLVVAFFWSLVAVSRVRSRLAHALALGDGPALAQAHALGRPPALLVKIGALAVVVGLAGGAYNLMRATDELAGRGQDIHMPALINPVLLFLWPVGMGVVLALAGLALGGLLGGRIRCVRNRAFGRVGGVR